MERMSVSTGKESWLIDHAFCVAEVTQSTRSFSDDVPQQQVRMPCLVGTFGL
jgi:hypothetical protein